MMDEGRPRGAGSIPVAWEGRGAPTDTAGAGNRAPTGRMAKGSACFGTATDPGGPHTED